MIKIKIMGTNNGWEAGGLAEGLDIDDPIARDIGQPLSLSFFAMEKLVFSFLWYAVARDSYYF